MPLPLRPAVILRDRSGTIVDAAAEGPWLAALRTDAQALAARLDAIAAGGAARLLLTARDGSRLAAEAVPLRSGGSALVLAPPHPATVLAAASGELGLTAREVDVLRLLLRGHPDRRIAAELVIAPETARDHTRRILRKAGVARRAELPARLFCG